MFHGRTKVKRPAEKKYMSLFCYNDMIVVYCSLGCRSIMTNHLAENTIECGSMERPSWKTTGIFPAIGLRPNLRPDLRADLRADLRPDLRLLVLSKTNFLRGPIFLRVQFLFLSKKGPLHVNFGSV